MTSARTAIAALLLLSGATSAKAQDPSGTGPGGSTATGQTEPARGEPIVRPKRGRLIDMIRAIAPPLIDAATSRPAPAREPVPEPVVPAEPPAPAIATPPLPRPETEFTPPPPPRPRPVQAAPRPPGPRLLPTAEAPRPAAPVAKPAPAPLSPPPAEAPPPPQTPVAVAADVVPQPAPVAPTEAPPAAVEPESSAPAWGALAVPLPGLLAVLLIAALLIAVGVQHLRRMRRIARTRAALALKPRLDLAAGACSTSGLSLTGPPLSIRARLLATDHG